MQTHQIIQYISTSPVPHKTLLALSLWALLIFSNSIQANLPNALTDSEHFYIHVSGEPKSGQAIFAGSTDNVRHGEVDFKSTGQNPGILAKRPDHYVPFLVPVYDEESSELQMQAYTLLREEDPEKYDETPDPIYKWIYRPEMQFTSYDLKIDEINRSQDEDGSGGIESDEIINIVNEEIPVITSDSLIDILYGLSTTELLPLDYFNAGETQELIFKIGEQEIIATLGEDQQITFDDVTHLNLLSPDDFLTISLYANNDMGNTLWEWAFELFNLFPPSSAGEVEVSADDNEVIVFANIPGYLGRPEDKRPSYTLKWTKQGNGSISPASETNKDGAFSTRVLLPRTAEQEVTVIATLDGNSIPTKSALYKIVPGEPKVINVTQSGQAAIAGVGEISLDIEVNDNWGNQVADGTAISMTSDQDVFIESDLETLDGIVKATITGLETAGAKTITITSGEAEATESLTIADISLSVTIPGNLFPKDKVNVQVSATTTVEAIDDVTVLLRTSKGNLENNYLNLSGGQGQTQLYVGDRPGTGSVMAQINGVLVSSNFTVNEFSTGGGRPKLDVPLLMADALIDGNLTIKDSQGDTIADVPYVAQTQLSVKGPANTTSTLSLGSLVNPVKEPVLDYPMFYYKEDHTVADRYSVINGTESNISMVKDSSEGFRGSYQFTDSMVRVPIHTALDKADQLGFSLYFKPHQAQGTLVNYSLRSQQLSLTADSRILYEIQTDTGSYSITSDPIDLNQWHQVGAHYNDGELQLEVNGTLMTTLASGTLIQQTGTTAIRLGDNYIGQMNRFKVIDWTAPDLAVFDNGLSTTTASYDENGNYTAAIQSTGQMGHRTIAQMSNEAFKLANFFIPAAYAAPAGESQSMQVDVVNSNYTGGSESLYMSTRQAVQDGFTQLGEAGKFLWDAHGETIKTVLSAADFVISFIPFVGDGKDLAMQAIYKLFDSADYDELVVIVATLGLAADGIGLISAIGTPITGGSSAIVAGAAITFSILAKTIKVYSKLMPKTLNKVLVNFFRKLYTRIKTKGWSYASNAIAFSALLYSILGDEELREMLYGMIQTDDDLFAWVDYIGEYVNQPEVTTKNEFNLLDFFISAAYASKSGGDFAVALKEVLEKAKLANPNFTNNQVGKLLTQTIKFVEKNADSIELNKLKFEPSFFKATLKAWEAAGEVGIKAVVQVIEKKGLRTFGYKEFIDDMGNVIDNAPELFKKIAQDNKSGVKQLLKNELGSKLENKVVGATFSFHSMSKTIKENVKNKILHIEHPVDIIDSKGKLIGERVYDSVIKTGTQEVHIDAKSWAKKNAVRFLQLEMRKRSAGTGRPGKLLKDLVEIYNKKDLDKFKIEWHFDSQSTGQESIYLEAIKKEIKTGKGGRFLRGLLGLDGRQNNQKWEDAKDAIIKKMGSDFIKVIE